MLQDLEGMENGDQLHGITRGQAEVAVRALARFHAWSWPGAGDQRFPPAFLPVATSPMASTYPALFTAGWRAYLELAPSPPDPAIWAFAARYCEFLPGLLAAVSHPAVLAHGDYRADNLFFGAGGVTVIDFQFACLMCGVADVAYLVSQSLTPAVRADSDRSFVSCYLDGLAAAGITNYDWDEAWAAVCLSLVNPVIAIRKWGAMGDRAQKLVTTLIERAIRTILDIDALAVLPR